MFSMFGEEQTPRLPWSKAMALLSKVVPAKSTLPFLRFVRVDPSEGGSRVLGTDLNVSLTLETDLPASVSEGLDFHALRAKVPVDRCDRVPLEDLPDCSLPGEVWTEHKADWVPLLGSVAPSISDDNTRLSLNGAYVHEKGVLATDGHSLLFAETPTTLDHIVPGKVVPLLMALLKQGPCESVWTSKNGHLDFRFPWGRLTLREVEGPYPQVHRLLIPYGVFSWSVDTTVQNVRSWVNKVPLIPTGKKGYRFLDLVSNGTTCEVQATCAAVEVVGMKVAEFPCSHEFRIRWDAALLEDFLGGLPGTALTIQGRNEIASTHWFPKGQAFQGLVMPCRWLRK